ncbi:hypothetical protein BKA65DRAFT_4654 [Rhexocercosporidium sp. MPI-PUGE-AT-0058]|nr:hypothetical protein BKA65DRAFT_4654 [Rhexocercosporidium sp. MPI-PUGE-AT-0058]
MLGSRAAAEAGPAAISSMSTPMPFLYQTKTLSNWTLTGANMTHRSRYCNAILRRHYSNFRISRVPAPPPKLSIKRTTNMSGREPPSIGNWTFNPESANGSELAGPQFGTSRNPWGTTTSPSSGLDVEESGLEPINKSLNAGSNDFRLDDGMGFSDDMGMDDEIREVDPFSSQQPEEIQDLTRKHGARDSTITDQERSAFQKIFSDIFKRSNRSSTSLDSSLTSRASDALPNDLFDMDNVPRDMQNAKQNLGNILSTAMRRQPRSREDMEAALEKYPPPLRAAAATAMGYIDGEMEVEKTQPNRSALLDMKELEALREPERIRVEGLMNAANTDFELMDIMEKEVFSLISKLGLDGGSQNGADPQATPLLNGKKKKGWKKASRARKGGKETPSEPQTDQQESLEGAVAVTGSSPDGGVSPLALYGPLYPSYLLLGLRLLDRSFAKPSPLSLSILPKIKSLGYISHILGGSTQFYNELLRIYRYRYDDFRGMIELLREMERAALEFDEDTLLIVRDVARLQLSIYRGEKGSTMKALWAMPEFAPNGFRTWREKIVKSIIEREEKARDHLQL